MSHVTLDLKDKVILITGASRGSVRQLLGGHLRCLERQFKVGPNKSRAVTKKPHGFGVGNLFIAMPRGRKTKRRNPITLFPRQPKGFSACGENGETWRGL